jgi:hypothetical protein
MSIESIHHDDHGGWTYWTVIATLDAPLDAAPKNRETAEVRWVPQAQVTALQLHPGFAATWPLLQG